MISVQRRRIQYIHCLLRHLRDRHGLNLTTQTSTSAPLVFLAGPPPVLEDITLEIPCVIPSPFLSVAFSLVQSRARPLLSLAQHRRGTTVHVPTLSSLVYYFGLKSSHADDMSLSSLSSMCAILHSDSYRFRTEKPVLCYKYKCPFIKDRKRQRHANPLSLLQANT